MRARGKGRGGGRAAVSLIGCIADPRWRGGPFRKRSKIGNSPVKFFLTTLRFFSLLFKVHIYHRELFSRHHAHFLPLPSEVLIRINFRIMR